MIAQSYMPAQDIHILRNLSNKEIRLNFGETLNTLEWSFNNNQLVRSQD